MYNFDRVWIKIKQKPLHVFQDKKYNKFKLCSQYLHLNILEVVRCLFIISVKKTVFSYLVYSN